MAAVKVLRFAMAGTSKLLSAFPYPVPARLHAENRARLVQRFSSELHSPSKPLLALLEGGHEQYHHATDHELVFRQESYFQWLFGVSEPEFMGLLNLSTGESTLFMPRLDESYAVWMGDILPPSHFQQKYEVDKVLFIDEMVAHIHSLQPEKIFLLSGKNTDSNRTHEAPKVEGLGTIAVDRDRLHAEINECRVIKTALELEVLRYVNRVSSLAHVAVMTEARPGIREYQLEASFLHHIYKFGGCRHSAYTCICGVGSHGAVLHYGHAAAPNDGEVRDGDLALLDMGGEYHCYTSDITCTFPINGKFTEKQRNIYNTVLKAQHAVFAAMKPGVSWPEMHRLAERVIAEELLRIGLIKGELSAVLENYIPALFMPHGLGHLMGLDTHDVGGYPKGTERIQQPGISRLRTTRSLQAGMVLTVEPGVYFIDALLLPALADPIKSSFLNRELIEEYRGFGGVRLEDDVIVTETGIENMTNVPRTIDDIEAVMAGHKTWTISAKI